MSGIAAKRLCAAALRQPGRALLTHLRHRPARNHAAQQSPVCAIPFVREHGRYWAVKRREFITLIGGGAAGAPAPPAPPAAEAAPARRPRTGSGSTTRPP